MSEITTELIHRLREHAAWVAANEYETPICLGDDLRGAADLIESLQAQLAASQCRAQDARNELCMKCGRYHEAHKGVCDGCRWKEN